MRKANNPVKTGERFFRLVAVRRAGRDRNGITWWHCRCDCGNRHKVRGSNLRDGNTKSCGCWRNYVGRYKEGLTHGGYYSRTYRSWWGMRQRCDDKKNPSYPAYGGRGIRICKRWREFETFRADMGEAPAGMSLDRIDNDGDYSPENCRWATQKQQSRNTRVNRYLTYKGKRRCVMEWSEVLGIPYSRLLYRARMGWSIGEIKAAYA